MANAEQVAQLKRSISEWNRWRITNPDVMIDLRDADLRNARLSDANLNNAHLSRATLRGADLRRADLRGATLTGADLTGAHLEDANLTGAYVTRHQLDSAKSHARALLPFAAP